MSRAKGFRTPDLRPHPRSPLIRRLGRKPLLVAVAACLLFVLFGGLVGGALGARYEELEESRFLVPLWAFYVVGFLNYLAFAAVLYRILGHIEGQRARGPSNPGALRHVRQRAVELPLLGVGEHARPLRRQSSVPGALGRPGVRALRTREAVGGEPDPLLPVGALRSRLDVRAVEAERRRLAFAVADRRAPAASAAPCYHSTIVAPEKPRSATH
jgi:hypothetical protein